MALPFTVEQFFHVFREYNTAIWPAQAVAYGLGTAATVLLFRRSALSDRVVAAVLATFWLWTGIAYHLVFFSRINKVAYGFGVLFVVEGLLLAVWGTIRPRLSFRYRPGAWPLVGLALMVYAMVIYPWLGMRLGHPPREVPWLGVTPCPTTIFTFGILLCAGGSGLTVLVIPLLWSIIGGSAALLLNVPQDYGLIAAGILGLIYLITRRRTGQRGSV